MRRTQPRGFDRRSFLRSLALSVSALMVARHAVAQDDEEETDAPSPVEPLLYDEGSAIIRRSEWSRAPGKQDLLKPAEGFTRLTVHHEGNGVNTHTRWDDVARDLNGILDAHMKKHWGDIAYHFVIDYSGRIWEGRSLGYEGAHVLANNEENLGVMLMGNFEEQQPSARQLASLNRLIAAVRRKYLISLSSIYGHRDLGHSVCPGRNLYAYVTGLRRDETDEEA
ncbi:MAG: N-acetylmuramoyl-L-alanine amidase [Lentisphaerae bacterium]|nr:N-acetylmuramoyl-L-alanine amidase [Lentisphaerota bacterium]